MTSRITFAVGLLVSLSAGNAWVPARHVSMRPRATALSMALDYNDPVVAEEFAQVQPMTYEEVCEELGKEGIRPSAAMNEMDTKLMLVEVRMRMSGSMPPGSGGSTKKKRPEKFASKFEEAMWTKPALKELYDGLKEVMDHNAMNVISEYINEPEMANSRYGKDYFRLLKKVKAAMEAPPPVNGPTLTFSGFPANMGEMGCKMTLEAVGPIAEFECTESEDAPILEGRVTFEDIESAKKAVAQYSGMDMGMGTILELTSV